MKSRLLREFVRSRKFRILLVIKMHGALSVGELRKLMPLSYTGVKQHCEKLAEDGFLIKRRRLRVSPGRPEELYELCHWVHQLLPAQPSKLLSQVIFSLKQIHGATEPEKILFAAYQQIIARYRKTMGSILMEDRLKHFAQLRQQDGCLIELEACGTRGAWRMHESYSPLAELLDSWPILKMLELQLYQKTLHPHVKQVRFHPSPFVAVYEIPH